MNVPINSQSPSDIVNYASSGAESNPYSYTINYD